jgi:hypothetical protein
MNQNTSLKHTSRTEEERFRRFDGQALTGRWNVTPTASSTSPVPPPELTRIFTTVTDLFRFISDSTYDLVTSSESIFVCEKEAREVPIDIPLIINAPAENFEEVGGYRKRTVNSPLTESLDPIFLRGTKKKRKRK